MLHFSLCAPTYAPPPAAQAALEEAWRQREGERDAEAASLRSEYAALDAKARQVLAAAEERERKVVAAEEAVVRRRRELEREHAGRVAEAEAAVRRLQAECQHQLELEAQRREGLAAATAAAEQRAAAAEARAAGAERALVRHREEHAASEAGRLAAELAAAQAALAAAAQRAAKAAEAKRKYKQQAGAGEGAGPIVGCGWATSGRLSGWHSPRSCSTRRACSASRQLCGGVPSSSHFPKPSSPRPQLMQVVRLAQEVALLQGQLAEVVGVKRAQLDAELAKLQARLFASCAAAHAPLEQLCWLGGEKMCACLAAAGAQGQPAQL